MHQFAKITKRCKFTNFTCHVSIRMMIDDDDDDDDNNNNNKHICGAP